MLWGSAGLTLGRAGPRFVIPRRCDDSLVFVSTRWARPSILLSLSSLPVFVFSYMSISSLFLLFCFVVRLVVSRFPLGVVLFYRRQNYFERKKTDYHSSGRMMLNLSAALGRLVLSGRELARLSGFSSRVTGLIDVIDDVNRGVHKKGRQVTSPAAVTATAPAAAAAAAAATVAAGLQGTATGFPLQASAAVDSDTKAASAATTAATTAAVTAAATRAAEVEGQ